MEENLQNNKTEYLLRFEEMKEAMIASEENLDKIINQQIKLYSIIEKNNEDKSFDEFLSDTKKQTEALKEQDSKLIEKIHKLDKILNECKENETFTNFLIELSEVLGLFRK